MNHGEDGLAQRAGGVKEGLRLESPEKGRRRKACGGRRGEPGSEPSAPTCFQAPQSNRQCPVPQRLSRKRGENYLVELVTTFLATWLPTEENMHKNKAVRGQSKGNSPEIARKPCSLGVHPPPPPVTPDSTYSWKSPHHQSPDSDPFPLCGTDSLSAAFQNNLPIPSATH